MSYAEFPKLAATIRKIMKARKLRYSHLARQLKVSEATIKRFFTASDGTLSRLVEICDVLEISFADLVAQSQSEGEPVYSLSESQEKFLADNPDSFAFFQELTDGKLSFKQIQEKHHVSRATAVKLARQLEKLGLVDWLASDRLKLRVKGTHNWLDHGPLSKRFMREGEVAFLDHLLANFGADSHFFTSSSRRMHPKTLEALIAELQSLFQSVRNRVYRDETFYPSSELVPVKWIMGVGPYSWAYKIRVK